MEEEAEASGGMLCASDEEGTDGSEEDTEEEGEEVEPVSDEEVPAAGRLSPLRIAAAATKPHKHSNTTEAAKMILELVRVRRPFLWEGE